MDMLRHLKLKKEIITKYYFQVHLDKCAYKIVSQKMADYLDENIYED